MNSLSLIDSHCHIHEAEFFPDVHEQEAAYRRAIEAGVGILCVATSEQASHEALEFVKKHEHTWAVLGVHPHEAKNGWQEVGRLLASECATTAEPTSPPLLEGDVPVRASQTPQAELRSPVEWPLKKDGSDVDERKRSIVGIGEIGLDYYYNNSPRDAQIAALEQQLQWAMDYNLPVSFHVREASSPKERISVWHDFWPVFDNFPGIRGVLHSFTDTQANLDEGFSRGLYVGVNGISTFTKDATQQQLYKGIPLEKMLLETDAPFLTPAPLRGKMNEPSYVGRVAEHAAALRGVPVAVVSRITTDNARRLFAI